MSSPRTLLPYHARWVEDRSGLKVIEKSRRIGMELGRGLRLGHVRRRGPREHLLPVPRPRHDEGVHWRLRRPGHTVTFEGAAADGLPRRRMEVVGKPWSPEIEAAWVEEVRQEYGDDAAEELDYVPAAGAGAWLSWEQIRKIEHHQAGDPVRYAGGCTVIGNDIARRRHLWVAWVLELVGDVAWTRQVVELQNASFAEQDDTLDELVERYRPNRIAMDQTGMGEKPVEDAKGRYGVRRSRAY